MKRGSDSSFSETRMCCSPSITDLTPTVVETILMSLPVKSIVICKSVCKAWHGLISDPGFSKLYLDRAKPCVLIRCADKLKFSRSLYLMEAGDGSRFDSEYCSCSSAGEDGCEHCRISAELKLKLKIPLRSVRLMLRQASVRKGDGDPMFTIGKDWTKRHLSWLDYRRDHSYSVVNSCNGFLCLVRLWSLAKFCVCNPVTGEFTRLPKGHTYWTYGGAVIAEVGFGFSPKQNRYKVITMSTHWKPDPATGVQEHCAEAAEIHTLGENSWRSLDVSGFNVPAISSPSYLNGSLYWAFVRGDDGNHGVASFDFDDERFHIHSAPALPQQQIFPARLVLAVLGGRLFAHTTTVNTQVDIWVAVNGCGASLSWTRLFSIGVAQFHEPYRLHTIQDQQRWFSYRLVHCLNDEAVVLFGGPLHEFIYYDRSQGLRFKQPKLDGLLSKFEVFAFTPSFVSLKDVVTPGSSIKVLNVNSSCAKLQLLEETYPLLLGKSEKLLMNRA